jgi:hypothetical protein
MGVYFFISFFFCTDMDNSDYSTQDDTSDSDYGEKENENDILILAAVAVEFVELLYVIYCKETL